MTSSRPSAARLAIGLVVVALLLATAASLQAIRERRFAMEPADRILYVTSPAVVTRLALSYRALAADVYWMRAIQYYGGMRLEQRGHEGYELLYPLLDLTTSLDPAFALAYRFGALFLSEPRPGGAGRPDLAVQLLTKGMEANPHRWEYPYDIGFVYYRSGDYTAAADWFRQAGDVAGAPSWIAPLAAVTLARGGDVATSRQLWQEIVGSSHEEWMQRVAQHRLLQLDAIEQIAELERLTAAYEQRFGDPPASWEEAVRAGFLRGVPLDPAGHPYELNPWWGDVTVSPQSPLWPLPADAPL